MLADHDGRCLLLQFRNYCVYDGLPVEMRPEHFDRAVQTYFTLMKQAVSPRRLGMVVEAASTSFRETAFVLGQRATISAIPAAGA